MATLLLPQGVRAARRQPRTLPRINRSNPITRGLVFCCAGKDRVNLVKHSPVSGSSGWGTIRTGRDGIGLGNSGSGNALTFEVGREVQLPLSAFTFFDDPDLGSGAFWYYPFSAYNGAIDTARSFSFKVNPLGNPGDSRILFQCGEVGGGNANLVSTTETRRFGNAASMVVRSNHVQGYLNGVDCGVSSSGSSCNYILGTSDGVVAIADVPFTGSYAFNGPVYLSCIWERELSVQEHLSLAENPWQIFEDELLNSVYFSEVFSPLTGTLGQFDPAMRLGAWF